MVRDCWGQITFMNYESDKSKEIMERNQWKREQDLIASQEVIPIEDEYMTFPLHENV